MGRRFLLRALDALALGRQLRLVVREAIGGAVVALEHPVDLVGEHAKEDGQDKPPDEDDREEVAVGKTTIPAATPLARHKNNIHSALFSYRSSSAAMIV